LVAHLPAAARPGDNDNRHNNLKTAWPHHYVNDRCWWSVEQSDVVTLRSVCPTMELHPYAPSVCRFSVNGVDWCVQPMLDVAVNVGELG
jgi:hypothetical protein